MTLPIDSEDRKRIPLYSGCLMYFPDALAEVARQSFESNDKHNPGEAMHHARGKSSDHTDCILRHLSDFGTLSAALNRGEGAARGRVYEQMILEARAAAWRALALLQELVEEARGEPMAPAARGYK